MADFRRYYHCNLSDALAGDVASLGEVAAWAAHLPPDSAVVRAVAPQASLTFTDILLRSAEFQLRWLVWAKTKDGAANRNPPEPYLFPWEDTTPPGTMRGDSMTVDEAAEFLGWAV